MVGNFDYRFRVILVGDHGAGKTSLVENFTTGNFTEPSEPTIGADFFTKIIELEGDVRVKLEVWDTAGQEKFHAITRAYYRDSVGVLLVYDICRRDTFEHISQWMTDARQYIEPHEPVFVLVGCKSDLADKVGRREVEVEEARLFGAQYQMFTVETSAKSGLHISASFLSLAQEIHDRIKAGKYNVRGDWEGVQIGPIVDHPPDTILMGEPESESKCCCFFNFF